MLVLTQTFSYKQRQNRSLFIKPLTALDYSNNQLSDTARHQYNSLLVAISLD
jgi:hypothetical protein